MTRAYSTRKPSDLLPWTRERIEQAQALWLAGKSAAEVAFVVGDTSRNAVLGLAFRRGWQRGEGAVVAFRATPNRPPRPIIPRPPPPEELISRGLTLVALTRADCRYITSGIKADALFCGHPVTAEGEPYCPTHRKLCWRKA